MSVQHIHAFLVHPGKGRTRPTPITGTTVPLTGGMFDLLDGIYAKSDHECDVDITFSHTPDGKQQNDCRDLVVSYLTKPDQTKGGKIAERLSAHTDGRSGLGLLFLIAGKVGREHKIVLSRFPTDSAIYVDDKSAALSVQFLERVFMKNKTSYKAVLYQHASLSGGLWSGAPSISSSTRFRENHRTIGYPTSCFPTLPRPPLPERGGWLWPCEMR